MTSRSKQEDEERIIPEAGSSSSFIYEEDGDPDREFTIDELLHHGGFGWTNGLMVAGAGIAVFMFGVLLQYITLMSDYLECRGDITKEELIAVKILLILGFIIGAPLFGMISDKIGRTKMALTGAYMVALFWAFSAVSVTLLFATMLCLGAGLAAMLPASVVYAYEYASLHHHGRVSAIIFGEYIIGQIWAIGFFHLPLDYVGWHWTAIILELPLLVLIGFYHCAKDTPKYFAVSGREDAAYQIALQIHQKNKVPMIRGRIKATEILKRGNCCSPCAHGAVKSTAILSLTFLFVAFGYFGISFGVYRNLESKAYCNSNEILSVNKCNSNTPESIINSIISSSPDILGLFMALIGSRLIGKKISLIVLLILSAVLILLPSNCFNSILFILELSLSRATAFASFAIVMIYAVQHYSVDKRCISFSYLMAFAMTGVYFAGIMTHSLRSEAHTSFIFLGVIFLVTLIPVSLLDNADNIDIDEKLDEQINLQ